MDANYVGVKCRSKENHHGDGHEEDGRSSFDYVNIMMRFKMHDNQKRRNKLDPVFLAIHFNANLTGRKRNIVHPTQARRM